MRALALVFALALPAPALAQTAEQFDLRCSGTIQRAVREEPQPEELVIHVDLTGMQWCIDDCSYVRPIVEANAGTIVFARIDDGRSYLINSVDRMTGRYETFSTTTDAAHYFRRNSTCEPAEFTPFPAARF